MSHQGARGAQLKLAGSGAQNYRNHTYRSARICGCARPRRKFDEPDFRGGSQGWRSATTDAHGFFRVPGLPPGAHILDVNLPDRHDFVARLVLLPDRKIQFLELDYGRIVPPEDDEHYQPASGSGQSGPFLRPKRSVLAVGP